MSFSNRVCSIFGRSNANVHARRRRRRFTPSDPLGTKMERRFLPGTMQAFFIDPAFTFAMNQAQSSSQVIPADDPMKTATSSSTNTGSGGAGAQTSITNYAIYVHQMRQDGSFFDQKVSATESGLGTITTALPTSTPGSGSNLQMVEFHATFQNLDSLQTDANGPYGIGGGPYNSGGLAGQTTTVQSTAPFQMLVQNTDGTPASGLITVHFDITISANDTSSTTGDQRFVRQGVVDIKSTYVDIKTIGSTGGIGVFLPGTATPLAIDSNFSNGPGGNPDLSFSYTGTFPTAASTAVAYTSQLLSGPSGRFGADQNGVGVAEYATKTSSLAWSFTMTA